jgi:hypothetical protein
LTDLIEASNTFSRMLHAIDARDWDGVRRAFADEVDIDYSTLFGAPAATVDADAHVAGWRAFAAAFDATQHITGPIVVTPEADAVTASTHVRAYHRIQGAPGGDMWMVAGHYRVRLLRSANGWRIAAITLIVFYQEGNLTLPDRARARVESRPPS